MPIKIFRGALTNEKIVVSQLFAGHRLIVKRLNGARFERFKFILESVMRTLSGCGDIMLLVLASFFLFAAAAHLLWGGSIMGMEV